MKAVKGGKTLKLGLDLEQRLHQGTTVQVQDILFNQPVRRLEQQKAGYGTRARTNGASLISVSAAWRVLNV